MTPTGVPLMKSSDQVSVGMGFRCIGKRQPPFDGCWGVVQRIELDRGRGPLMKKRPPMVAVVVTLMMAVVVTLLLLLLSSRPRQQGRSPPPVARVRIFWPKDKSSSKFFVWLVRK